MVLPRFAITDPLGRQLHLKYQEIKRALNDNPYHLPIFISSTCETKKMSCDIFGIFGFPYKKVGEALSDIHHWPDMMLLHENVKTCVIQKNQNDDLMTFYFGRKYYQPPEKGYKIIMAYHLSHKSDDFLDMAFTAEEGPLHTRNYLLRIQAVPIDDKTFVWFHFSYNHGNMLKTALKIYYATLARHKVGFTVNGYDKQKNPIYVRGTQGVIERNAVRYYFSMLCYLTTMQLPETERFEQSLRTWYALISKFPKQLVELSQDVYIENKLRERENQIHYHTTASPLNDG